eukprot:ANDGO_05656.mRNA.1 Glucokinase 1
MSVVISESGIEALRSSSGYVAAVDVGGTHTRVMLVTLGSPATVVPLGKLHASTIAELVAAAESLEAAVRRLIPDLAPATAAALAVAGPVRNNGTAAFITNYLGSKDISVEMLPPFLFPRGATRLLNDLEGACYGFIGLSQANALQECFHGIGGEQIQPSLGSANVVVLAPGTGMGVGTIVHGKSVVPGEASHITMSSDSELVRFAAQVVYAGRHKPEFEDLCSGRGLVLAYKFFSKGCELQAHDIATRALDGSDPAAIQALQALYQTLLECAQTVSLAVMPQYVVVLGDNQVSNDAFVQANAELFVQGTFLNHPKRDWLKGIGVITQFASRNLNLDGSAFIARQVAEGKI